MASEGKLSDERRLRLELIQTVSRLPPTQFEQLAFVLKAPPENMPDASAVPGKRASDLLEWAESPVGPGLVNFREALTKVIIEAPSDLSEHPPFDSGKKDRGKGGVHPSFPFEAATIVGVDKGFLGLGKTVRTERRQGKAQYFREDLGDGIKLDLVRIPAGVFTMGSPDNEEERRDDEGPQHEVSVSEFWMGRYPVTQAQWRVVACLPKVVRDLNPDPSSFKGYNRPVETVSWDDAIEFCQRLSLKTGCEFRLPSEAEWEYACRAGTTTAFHFGETISTDLANYDGGYNYGSGPEGEFRGTTTPVGSFKAANGFGLYDMHGNVCEWCMDCWHEDYRGAPIDGSAWLSSEENKSRIFRGGCWIDDPRRCRSAYRDWVSANNRNDPFGFRVCCSASRTLP